MELANSHRTIKGNYFSLRSGRVAGLFVARGTPYNNNNVLSQLTAACLSEVKRMFAAPVNNFGGTRFAFTSRSKHAIVVNIRQGRSRR